MTGRRVNAVITITIPLDVPVDASKQAKLEAAVAAAEASGIDSAGKGYTVEWEDVEVRRPPTDSLDRAKARCKAGGG